jgi:uncharacterized membrane protein
VETVTGADASNKGFAVGFSLPITGCRLRPPSPLLPWSEFSPTLCSITAAVAIADKTPEGLSETFMASTLTLLSLFLPSAP